MSGYLHGTTYGDADRLFESIKSLVVKYTENLGDSDSTESERIRWKRFKERYQKVLDVLDGPYGAICSRAKDEHAQFIYSKFNGLQSQCGAIVYDDWRTISAGLDLWKEHMAKCDLVAASIGYTRALVTHRSSWEGVDILKELGWKELDRFVNRRSGNTVVILGHDIDPIPE
jgi:hypothetical protein